MVIEFYGASLVQIAVALVSVTLCGTLCINIITILLEYKMEKEYKLQMIEFIWATVKLLDWSCFKSATIHSGLGSAQISR